MLTIYADLANDPPSIIERRVREGINLMPHVWTPATISHVETMAVLGALRLGVVDATCIAAWDGTTLRGRGIIDAALRLYADENTLKAPEPMRFSGAPKMWCGRVTLVHIIRTARGAWRQIEAVRHGERSPGSEFEAEQPYAAGWIDGAFDEDRQPDADIGARAGRPFGATGYDALNVADPAEIGWSPRMHNIELAGGRPMVELLAIMGAVALIRLGLWMKCAPRIPVIDGTPLRHWYDLERLVASDRLVVRVPAVRASGRRRYLADE